MVLHVHGMDEAGVQFPVGPQKTQDSDCSEFCAFVEGAAMFLFEPELARVKGKNREPGSRKISVRKNICDHKKANLKIVDSHENLSKIAIKQPAHGH